MKAKLCAYHFASHCGHEFGLRPGFKNNRVWGKSSTLFKVGLSNLANGCILGLWSAAYHF